VFFNFLNIFFAEIYFFGVVQAKNQLIKIGKLENNVLKFCSQMLT